MGLNQVVCGQLQVFWVVLGAAIDPRIQSYGASPTPPPGQSVGGQTCIFTKFTKSQRVQTMSRLAHGLESGRLQSIAGVLGCFGVFGGVLGSYHPPWMRSYWCQSYTTRPTLVVCWWSKPVFSRKFLSHGGHTRCLDSPPGLNLVVCGLGKVNRGSSSPGGEVRSTPGWATHDHQQGQS